MKKSYRRRESDAQIAYEHPCTYCGTKAGTVDHVIPYAYVHNFDVVPCCSECNRTLNDLHFPTFETRCRYLMEKYFSKYAKLINMPYWTNGELMELGENLRTHVMESLVAKENILQRLDHLDKQATE